MNELLNKSRNLKLYSHPARIWPSGVKPASTSSGYSQSVLWRQNTVGRPDETDCQLLVVNSSQKRLRRRCTTLGSKPQRPGSRSENPMGEYFDQ